MADEVETVLADYDETFLTCRDLMHSWRIMGHFRTSGWSGSNGAGSTTGGWGATKRLLRCERCGMERTDAFDGVTTRHSYDQPDGYRIQVGGSGAAGSFRVSKSDIRTEQLRRAHVFDSEEAMRKAMKRRASVDSIPRSVGRKRTPKPRTGTRSGAKLRSVKSA